MVRQFKIVHKGDILSMNEALGRNWSTFTPKLKKLMTSFKYSLLRAKPRFMEQFGMHCRYNSGEDVDNVWYTCKKFIDQLRAMQYVPEDYNKFYKWVKVEHDENLPRNTLIFEIYA